MKPFLVIAAFVVMLGVGVFASMGKRYLKWLMFLLPMGMTKWPSYSLMLFSDEWYRGSTRGMEVSLPYLIAFAIAVALIVKGKMGKFFIDGGSVWFFLYWAFQLPSLQNCDNTLYAWFEIWKVPMMFIVYRAVRGYCRFTDDYETPLLGLSVVLICNFYSIVNQHFIIHMAQARGLFSHQNSMAMWASPMAAVFYAAYLNGKQSRRWKYFCVCFFMAAASVIRSYSRGAMASLPISYGIITVVSFFRNFNFRMTSRLLPLFAVGAFGMLLAVPRIIERFDKAAESSGRMRVVFAEAASRMIKDHPLAGIGLNNWGIKINPPYEYSQHREEFHMTPDFKDGIVETIYLLTWSECGTPCFISLLGLFFWHWLKAFRLTGRLRGKPQFFIAVGFLGGFTAIYMQSCLEWVLKQSINFCELCICFGMIAALNDKYGAVSRKKKIPAVKPEENKKGETANEKALRT